MENLEPLQLWLLMAAAAYVAFMAGRATARKEDGASREERAHRAAQAAEHLFASLTPEQQSRVDAQIRDRKVIDAIKLVREFSGAGLKESKEAVDWRRRHSAG